MYRKSIIALLPFAILLISIALAITVFIPYIIPKTIQITHQSIAPDTVSPTQSATLHLSLMNNDAKNKHNVSIRLKSAPEVSFYLEGELLPQENGAYTIEPFILYPSSSITYEITIRAGLQPGSSSATYRIEIEIWSDGAISQTNYDQISVTL